MPKMKRNCTIKEYFTKEDSISSRCKICCNVLKHHGNTTNLSNHIKRKHPHFLNTNPSAKKSKIPSSFCNVFENDHLDDNSFDEVLEINSPSADPNESSKIFQPACSEACPKSPPKKQKQLSIATIFKKINDYSGNVPEILLHIFLVLIITL